MPALWPILSQVCLWLALLAGVGFAIGRRARHPRCRMCGYDLSEHAKQPGPWVCPECGNSHARPAQLIRRARSKVLKYVAIVLLAAWYAFGVTPRVQARGWPGVVPTLALVGICPWTRHDEFPFDSYSQALAFNRPLASKCVRDRLDEELQWRSAERSLTWPMDWLLAWRTGLEFARRDPNSYFVAFPRPQVQLPALDPMLNRDGDNPLVFSWSGCLRPDSVPPDCELALATCLFSARQRGNESCILSQVGHLLFVRATDRRVTERLQRDCAVLDSIRSETRPFVMDPAGVSSIAAVERMRGTTISVESKTASVGQLLRIVAHATDTPVSLQSSPLIVGLTTEELIVPVPPTQGADTFLDAVFRNAREACHRMEDDGSEYWTVVDGEFAAAESRDRFDNAFFIGYYDTSGLVDDNTLDPWERWKVLREEIPTERAGSDGLEFRRSSSFRAALNGDVAIASDRYVQVRAQARTHEALRNALAFLRARTVKVAAHARISPVSQ